MENAIINCPADLSALRPDDQEVFQRVWSRVMPQAGESCPIAVETTVVGGDLPCACTAVQPAPLSADPSLPSALRGVRSPHRGSDFPDQDDVPRLGPSSAVYGEQLQRQVTAALESWQLYRYLARRASGPSARVLTTLASERHKAARRLAAAYFLISGVRFWPVDRLTTPSITSYLGAIRRAYQSEQQLEQAYLLSAADTTDEALAELYRDLALQSRDHGELLRALLEQSRL